ncbi:hypothetical protein AVEN_17818-1, partial [Araneus ventricosus]
SSSVVNKRKWSQGFLRLFIIFCIKSGIQAVDFDSIVPLKTGAGASTPPLPQVVTPLQKGNDLDQGGENAALPVTVYSLLSVSGLSLLLPESQKNLKRNIFTLIMHAKSMLMFDREIHFVKLVSRDGGG